MDDRVPRRWTAPPRAVDVSAAVVRRRSALRGYVVLATYLRISLLPVLLIIAVSERDLFALAFLALGVIALRWLLVLVRVLLGQWLHAVPPGVARSDRRAPREAALLRRQRRRRYPTLGDRRLIGRRLAARVIGASYITVIAMIGLAASAIVPVVGSVVAVRLLGGRVVLAYRRARVYGQRSASEELARDPRKPVVLLRSFDDDLAETMVVRSRWSVRRHWIENWLLRDEHLEEVVARQLWVLGPVVALGRPGDDLAPLGAVRTYVTQERWQQEVLDLVDDALLVVVVLGQGAGLRWELEQIARLDHLAKTVLVLPPDRERAHLGWEECRQSLVRVCGAAPALPPGPAHPLVVHLGRSEVTAIFGNRHDEWHYEVAMETAAGFAAAA